MQITICERGCGRTSQDPEAKIEKLSVKVRLSHNDEAASDHSIEACKVCRETISTEILKLTRQASLTVDVRHAPIVDGRQG